MTRLPACDTTAEGDGALGSSVEDTVVPVSSMTSTLGCPPEVPGTYTAVVDSGAFGWHAEAFVDLYCEGGMPGAAIKKAVQSEAGVVSAHTVAGEASALLHVMAEDTKSLELALERIRATQGVTRTVTEVVLSTLFTR